MQAIIFADRDGRELSPLNQYYTAAMLPILSKPVLEYAIERIINLGVREIIVVLGREGEAIKQYFETGSRWSTPIHYVSSAKDESPANVVRRLGKRLDETFYALRGDVLHDPNDTSLRGICSASRVESENLAKLKYIDWLSEQLTETENTATKLHNDLASPKDYYQATMTWASHNYHAYDSAGRAPIELGIRANVCPIVLESGQLQVGNYSRIADSSRCTGNVVIGQYCMIERGAKIKDSLILDNTFVGEGLEIKNSIVLPDRIIRIDLEADFVIEDRFLIAATNENNEPSITPISDKVLAVALLIATSPVWLVRLLIALFSGHRVLPAKIIIEGNNGAFLSVGFGKQSRLTPSLPRLLGVIGGQLRLFGRLSGHGNTNDNSDKPEQDPWTPIYERIPFGCYSRARLIMSSLSDKDQHELMEIEMYGLHGKGNRYFLRLLAQSLKARVTHNSLSLKINSLSSK